MRQGAFNSRNAKVNKFPTAFDKKTGEYIAFPHIRKAFFIAANSPNPKKAIAALREQFDLACPHCRQARLSFSFGSEEPDGSIKAIAGGVIPGNPSHLKTTSTKVKENHAPNCIGVVLAREGHVLDGNKGYRVHLNLKRIAERDPRSKRLIMRNAGERIIVLDPDLKDREPFNVNKVEQILPLMRSGQQERLEDSVVIRGDTKTSWSQFMIPANDTSHENPNLANFVRSLQATPAENHPVLMDLRFKNAVVSYYRDANGNSRHYKFSKTAPFEVKGLGKIVIVPELRVQNEHLFDRIEALHKSKGEIFVLAEKAFIYKRDSKSNIYHMTFILEDPDMMVEASLNDIMAISRKRHDAPLERDGLFGHPHP